MSRHGVKIDIGVDGAFTTRRWEEPDSYLGLVRELGYEHFEFCADNLDPFFSGDREFQLAEAAAIKEAAQRHRVHITNVYTGMATHRFHGLSHRHPAARRRMREWIENAMDIALAMGTDSIGGHWDAYSIETMADPARLEERYQDVLAQFRSLAVTAKKKGMRALYVEQMYIPSEKPWTLKETEDMLLALNKDREGVPIYVTVDVGHQAGMHYGLSGPDLDYVEWVREFGAASEIIHLQQTTPESSAHWPFTGDYNEQGHVRIPEVLEALEESHRRYEEHSYASYLPQVENQFLILEVIPGSTITEDVLLAGLRESAGYLRQFVPEGGLTFQT